MRRQEFIILPFEVAGYATRLCHALNREGSHAEFWNLGENPFEYEWELPARRLPRLMCILASVETQRSGLVRVAIHMLNTFVKIAVVAATYRRNSVIVSMSGRSLIKGWDCVWAQFLGATVITVFLGSESRPPYLNGVYMNSDREIHWNEIANLSKEMSLQVSKIQKRSDYVICNPGSAQFICGQFVNWFHIGLPIEAPSLGGPLLVGEKHATGSLKILHAPSRPRQKGTSQIRGVIDRLKMEGFDLEFVELIGVPNTEVRERLQHADLVIDELYSDVFLGGLGVEAVQAGVPVLTFGYAAHLFDQLLGQENYPSAGYNPPERLYESIKTAVTQREFRENLRISQSNFISQNWLADQVARNFQELAKSGPRSNWLVQTASNGYFLGFGVSKECLQVRLKELNSRFGMEVFRLDRSSLASEKMMEFINGGVDADS